MAAAFIFKGFKYVPKVIGTFTEGITRRSINSGTIQATLPQQLGRGTKTFADTEEGFKSAVNWRQNNIKDLLGDKKILTDDLFVKEVNKPSNKGLLFKDLAEKLDKNYVSLTYKPIKKGTLSSYIARTGQTTTSKFKNFSIDELKQQLQNAKPLTYTNKRLSEMTDAQIQKAAGGIRYTKRIGSKARAKQQKVAMQKFKETDKYQAQIANLIEKGKGQFHHYNAEEKIIADMLRAYNEGSKRIQLAPGYRQPSPEQIKLAQSSKTPREARKKLFEKIKLVDTQAVGKYGKNNPVTVANVEDFMNTSAGLGLGPGTFNIHKQTYDYARFLKNYKVHGSNKSLNKTISDLKGITKGQTFQMHHYNGGIRNDPYSTQVVHALANNDLESIIGRGYQNIELAKRGLPGLDDVIRTQSQAEGAFAKSVEKLESLGGVQTLNQYTGELIGIKPKVDNLLRAAFKGLNRSDLRDKFIAQITNDPKYLDNFVMLASGGRVHKFIGGYINPEDIQGEINLAEETDGEIITQKEAIERLMRRLVGDDFQKGGLIEDLSEPATDLQRGFLNSADTETVMQEFKDLGKPITAPEAEKIVMQRFKESVKDGDSEREFFQVGGPVGGGAGGAVGGGFSGAVGNNKVGNIQAVLAGIAAGVIDIPKGAFSLGASLMDLGLGTSTAASVENFFDNLTSFDEIAEQRTAGEIARIITNLGIPGSQAWKIGTGLAKKAMFSRNAGKYFTPSDPKIAPKIDDALNAKGRLYATLGGAAGIGVADAIFVGDPERVGTLGDAFDFGPTQLRPNNENDAAREVINRLKFGLDSSLLLGLVGGSGSAIKSMIKRRNELESNNDFIDKILSKIRPRGDRPMDFFRLEREQIGIRAGDVNRAQEISRAVDRHIDGMFPFLKPMYEKSTIKTRSELMKTLNDTLLSGKTEFTPIGRVAFGQMDDKLVKTATEKMQALGAKPEAIKGIFNSFDEIRSEWGDMFTALGSRMDDDAYAKFSGAFSKKMNDYLSTTYDVFRNKSLLPFLNFKAGEESVDKLVNLFKKTAADKGETLTTEQARHYVDQIVETATPGGKGLPLREDATAGVFFEVNFAKGNKFFEDFVDKSILGDIEYNPKFIQLNSLKPEAKAAIDEVLGRIQDPIQTILQGTQKLSLITRRNQFFDELLQQSKAAQAAGGKGFFYTKEAEAFAAFGKNIKRIDFDPSKTLEAGVTNPLNGLYAQTGVANALEQTGKNLIDNLGSFGNVYANFILYPKATSQLAKTVLSPITHMRNLFSASAFAAANGLLPGFIGPDEIVKNMKSAYGKLQFGRADDAAANKEYRRLLRLGVVNSNVTLGDLSRLLEDVKFGENITATSGVKGVMRQLGKAKKFATDLYTAEDDLWKIYTFATERGRFEKAFKRAGITKSADELDEMAADIVRNNVPNYDYVSDFVKGLRQFPIGNFVSFPAEIMRTSVNIMTRGLKEYNEEAIVNGVKVYPLRNIGLQRLFGFAATTTAVPYALVEGAKALYDVSGVEMDALRRFVPDWSKNSTIIPVRSDDGELKYIDFSHANAYDTMIRPVTTLINNIRDGQVEEEAISKSILQGVFEATKELGQPFLSEAIWTEAAADIIARGGRTRDGRRLFTDQTPNGEKAMAIVGHLVDSQLPGSIDQFKRFDLALEGVDVIQKGKFDKYGRQYEFGDELLGVIGMRAVEVDPVNSMKFKIADYTRGISNARREFTTPLLRGGAVTPEQIVDRYQIANNQAYKVQQEIFRDYYAARTLGAKETALDREFADRVSRVSLAAIKSGRYKPFIPSENIIASFGENARKLGQRNPYLSAKPVIDRIIRQYNNLPLILRDFPILPNPFSVTAPPPTAGINTGLPNLNLGLSMPTATGITGNTIQKGQTVFGPLDSVFGGT